MFSIEISILIVFLMYKHHSEIQVGREFKNQGLINLPSRLTIKIIYSDFLNSDMPCLVACHAVKELLKNRSHH